MSLSKKIQSNLGSNVLPKKTKINKYCSENNLYVSAHIKIIIGESIIEGHSTGYFPLDNEINSLEHLSRLGRKITICIDTNTLIKWNYGDIQMAYYRAKVRFSNGEEIIAHISIHQGTDKNIKLSTANAKENKFHCNNEKWREEYYEPNYELEIKSEYKATNWVKNKILEITKETIYQECLCKEEIEYMNNHYP
jgi:hypothetical protein